MKKGMLLGFLCLAVIVAVGNAQDLVPVAVSPGVENGPAVVRQSCPTFSWTAVSWALTYKVVVFKAAEGETPAYEKIAASVSPVLVKEIPGKALSWTPSADESLINGGSYIWYVGAMVNVAQGSWSEGRTFIIEESAAWGVVSEPPARKTQPEARIEQNDSPQILRDKNSELTEKAKENFNLAADLANPELTEIQGTEGTSNTFYGTSAGNTTMTGLENSFFGSLAGNKNTSGAYNTFMGRGAGYQNTTGLYNTFVGRAAGYSNTAASANTFLGYLAGFATTGGNNTFIGRAAGTSNTTGYANAFLGDLAGYVNTSGYSNTFVGQAAGKNNKNGVENSYVGYSAGISNTSGSDNAFFGPYAGYKNTIGQYNTIVGWYAGYENQTGHENTFIGDDAGYDNVSGSDNVFIGNEAGLSETGSDKLYISNTNTDNPIIYGDFSTEILHFNAKLRINTSASIVVPTHLLDVGISGAYCDGGAWVDGSSREYKENIKALTSAEALQAFKKLEPVKFNYKENKAETYLGFIAEDVPDLVAMNDRKGLNPMDMVAMLTKVVQEQMKVNQEQQKSIAELQKKISKLEERSRKEK